MVLTVNQLKSMTLPLFKNKQWSAISGCPPVTVSMYDILTSFFGSNSFTIYSNSSLSGNGTSSSPLGIAQQGATAGQVLTWSGSAWLPSNPSATIQLLTLVDDVITLSAGGGTIPVADLITSDVSNILTVGSDGLLKVGTVTGALPAADTAGQIAYWTGSAWDVAIERREDFSPPSGNTVTVAFTPISSLSIRVYLNGVLKRNLDDYTISGTLITFMYNFAANDKVTVTYFK